MNLHETRRAASEDRAAKRGALASTVTQVNGGPDTGTHITGLHNQHLFYLFGFAKGSKQTGKKWRRSKDQDWQTDTLSQDKRDEKPTHVFSLPVPLFSHKENVKFSSRNDLVKYIPHGLGFQRNSGQKWKEEANHGGLQSTLPKVSLLTCMN